VRKGEKAKGLREKGEREGRSKEKDDEKE